ncbi:endonuclease/exonuclease/phosphatase family protein [Rhodobacter calidifons]|uniref:Endonuclease/exonuclease/phosphatase family protein n=1 Tax=Rhodobacter calidifons TaxID=2715277 RepID=A0ABX0G638_9RHOB|nr:endonuclease/exonuclease/phosphatase family protein [Rhodobacter calidifons]NHB76338.1 endonuclease/exonuclease/phosphatase family protein [Rhodobacter calidifons]
MRTRTISRAVGLCCALSVALALLAGPAAADPLRIATWNVGLDRRGPGLLVQDLAEGKDPQVAAVVRVLAALDADVVLLTVVDYDRGGVALRLLADRLEAAGAPYPHRLAFRPNTGMQTGFDIDGNGRPGDARDAQGFGLFSGQGGMAVLSRLPLDAAAARDFSAFLWRDLPGGLGDDPPDLAAVQRLATTGFWDVPVLTPDGPLHLLAWHATPPVFDGPEDRNGRRNHDEAAFWRLFLEGKLPMPPPDAPFVLLGDGNLDPADGDGLREGIGSLLAHPALQDPAPRGSHGRTEPDHAGDPALDTVLYAGLGGLRLDYVLPAAGLEVTGAGVLWPASDDPLWPDLGTASRHFPVWVDLALP